MANLLDQASIVLTPTAYDNGKVLCAKPSEPPYGDFDFSRNSAATRVNAQGLVENVQILSSNLVQNGDFSEEGVEEVSNGSFSQEGVQLVTNGDFATDSNWNKGSGWSISGGKATSDGTQVSASYLSQTLSGISQGKQYITEFDIDVISGSFRFNTLGNNLIVTESGHYVIYSTSVSGITLYLEAQVGFTGSIDNVSVREVGQDWTLGTGWSIGEDKAIATSTANSISIYQNNTVEVGKTYKVTYTVADYVEGGIYVRVGSGVNGVVRFGNGTYTEYITQAGDNKLYLTTYTTTTLSITNISVKEVGQNWDLGSGTTIGDGIANITQSGGVLSQSGGILVSGKSFKITFTISNYVSGSIAVSNLTPTTYRSGNGTYTLNAVGAGGDFIFYSSSFIGSVTNISVIEITDDTNLPRINYEGFSYQDALGSEQIVNGDFSNGSTGWNFASNWSVVNNQATTLGVSLSPISQSALVNGTNRLTFDVIDGGAFVYTNYPIFSKKAEFTTVGTHTIDLLSDGVGINQILYIYNNGAGNSATIDNVSVKEYLGQEVVPDSGCGSWLFEPQSTNLIEYSNDYADAYWIKATSGSGIAPVVTSNYAISPDGTQNADRIQFDATTSGSNGDRSRIRTTLSLTDTSYYTFSFYAKSTDGTDQKIGVLFDNSQIETFTITDEWQRFEATQQQFGTSSTCGLDLRSGNAFTSDILVYGIQLEEQTYATSYIPTSGSSVTRNQDVCTNGGSLASINSTEGVLYAEIAALSNDGTNRFIIMNDSTNSNRLTFRYRENNFMSMEVHIGGVLKFGLVVNSADITLMQKIALKYKESDYAFWINGVEVGTNTLAEIWSANTLNNIDFDGFGQPFFGKTKALAVFPYLSDAELTELTTI